MPKLESVRVLMVVFVLCCLVTAAGCTTSRPAGTKPFTIIVLPDTQNYADARVNDQGKRAIPDYSRFFYGQTQWIKDNRDKMNIAMVAHLGDIVQTNHADEWKIADRAFKTLDGVVPCVLAVGNHDYTGDSRETLFNDYFPSSRFDAFPWYGGHFGKTNDNSYALFEAGEMKFLIISLEWKTRDAVLEWANSVVSRHPDRRCIVVTHIWLQGGERVKGGGGSIPGNAPAAVWDKFVSRHENIFLVLSGHLADCRLTSTGKEGNAVYQLQSDYQNWPNGGSGYLRIMAFFPDEDRISVQTYSCGLNQYATLPSALFELKYEMKGPAEQGR